MNKVETQTRILRHLSIIEYQVTMLGRHGQNISMYAETAVAEAMTAVTGATWKNLKRPTTMLPA